MKKRLIAAFTPLALILAGCNTTPTQDGAVLGGLLGAGTGAIIGHQSGRQGEGALIGAGVGAITGAIVGDQVDERRQRSYPQNQYSHPQPSAAPARTQHGHYDVRIVRTPSGETYEERVWVPYK
ncbi:MAG: glycine zipper 2TM domain-containing protein [Candidatus Hydrogenedentes bacterium]|nr:glycine zipper 2TM domain-containing protein [Candidatus Hydrogenedentota bacterium]